MSEFTISIIKKDDGSLYARMSNEGYQTAIVSDPLLGNTNDLFKVRNFFQSLGQVFMERCLPESDPKYVEEKLADGTTRQVAP